MKRGRIVIISGPSGSGKTTLYKQLLANHRSLVKSVSVTTRPRREGEKHGRDYFFVSPKMFAHKKKAGHFLEWEKVFDNYYGTPNRHVEELLRSGKNVLLCIDVKGAQTVVKKHPRTLRIFIKTSTFDVLTRRLKARASENSDIIQLRLKAARAELKEAKRYDYVVVNDQLNRAHKKLESILKSEL